MCLQLPDVATIPQIIRSQTTRSAEAPEYTRVTDDVYDSLIRLGPYSLPCLTDSLLDTRWMSDPRDEILLGVPLVGDVAYLILLDKGMKDLFPAISLIDEPGMDDYFLWSNEGDHRRRLQQAVRAWVIEHPDCCGKPPIPRTPPTGQPRFAMSPGDLARTRLEFSELLPGMSPTQVLQIKGQPDAIDHGVDADDHTRVNLLGFATSNHNENLAYIYFTERWTEDIASRDPLRDRYVIVRFSAEGKMTRTFSSDPKIPPIFPPDETTWRKLMWGEASEEQADEP